MLVVTLNLWFLLNSEQIFTICDNGREFFSSGLLFFSGASLIYFLDFDSEWGW